MTRLREIAAGLRFPEGPVALEDGSILVVEIARKTLTRVSQSGLLQVVAVLGGGPNGAAIGPDGRCYVCNNGGLSFIEGEDRLLPGLAPPDYAGGWLDAVDLASGRSERLYEACGNIPLRGPNDLVFDSSGGFWFTDLGKTFKRARQRDRGAVFYAKADGSFIKQAIFPLEGPNGIGLSPDERILYVAESHTGRIWAYDIAAPGELRRHAGPIPGEVGRMHFSASHYAVFDSLAVDVLGNVCVADIPHGGISVISPEGNLIEQHKMPDPFTTNICFGGAALTTAFITLSSSGRLVAMDWPRAGLPLPWLNQLPKDPHP
jgi:gluconolactonase